MTESFQRRAELGRAVMERDGARCGSCRALITWVITTTGKSMPIDREPVASGNVRATGRKRPNRFGTPAPEVEVVEASSLFAETTDELRYVSHFATCPNASEHRR